MLLRLHIKNAALIESADIEFGNGLNILTGETGAGKSMIIDSVNFVLGERTTKEFVRKDAKSVQVVAEFEVCDKQTQSQFEQMGIEIEDNIVIIQRTMSSEGKSSNRVNGIPVTASMLKQLSESLIDIHGQHEHQSLLNPSKHIDILDSFCAPEIDMLKNDMSKLIKEYKLVTKEINDISGDELERESRIEKLEFQINEIFSAQLKEGEEEALEERREYLNNIDKVVKNVRESSELLYGDDESFSALDNVEKSLVLLGEISEYDNDIFEIYNSLSDISELLKDMIRRLRKYEDEIEVNPNEIDDVEERLDLIYRLKKKYGQTIESINSFGEKAKNELELIFDSGDTLEKLNLRKKELLSQIKEKCAVMSSLRQEKAKKIGEKIEKQLKDLEMNNVEFKIAVSPKETFSIKGNDNVEFLISPNMGEDMKPLAKIASGGEMSRVMLAIKTVVSDAENIDTFIFDEIDTGVSGKTASKVGRKMAAIGRKKQVLCITHLPQIVAMADSHFLIEKNVEKNKTVTKIICLDRKGSIEEIARLMGNENDSIVTMAASKMKDDSDKYKSSELLFCMYERQE